MFWTLLNNVCTSTGTGTSTNTIQKSFTFKQIFTKDHYTQIYSDNDDDGDGDVIYSFITENFPIANIHTDKIFTFSIKMFEDLIMYECENKHYCFQYKCDFNICNENSNIEFDYTYLTLECNQMPNLPNDQYDVIAKLKIQMVPNTDGSWKVLEEDIDTGEQKVYILI